MVKLGWPYRTYSFVDQDPVIGKLFALVREQDTNLKELSAASGVKLGTINAWFRGRTKRPQHATVVAVARALDRDIALVD
jgi:transcriptional regulator with XRE-family HTH domain